MGFLDNYEDVNTRIKRFRSEFPTGRLISFIEDIDLDKGIILIRAEAYRNYEDALPSAVDYALGSVATLPQNMRKWFIEDCVTSAYGRVIGLLSPSDGGRPTAQDMAKVETATANTEPDYWTTKFVADDIPTLSTAMATIEQGLGGVMPEAAPRCKHGTMIWGEGKSAKTGKDWAAYKCSERNRASQCDPIWQVLDSQGKWKPQQ